MSPASAVMVTASAETTLVATTPSLVVNRVIASAVVPCETTSVAVISPAAETVIAPFVVSTSVSATDPSEVISIPPAVRLDILTSEPSATSIDPDVSTVIPAVTLPPISSCAVKVISPPAVKSTVASSVASLIEPAVEVRLTVEPTSIEPISRSFASVIEM